MARPRATETRATSLSTIRPCTADDAAAVASILNESILARDSTMIMEPTSAWTVLKWLDHLAEREALLVIEEEGTVVGWGIIRQYSEREGYRFTGETSVFLARSHTGRGLGTQLQRALLERCEVFGYHHLVAKIFADNDQSIRMHRNFGYELVGVQREVGMVDGVWRDVAIMQLLLPGT